MTYLEILRANIGAELGRRGLHQKDAARALGLSNATFSGKLHGRSAFKLVELMRLAAWLGISFSRLTEGFDAADELSPGADGDVAQGAA
ncbi:helix-turn-helix domain-containing protein [Nesterenkonia sp. K-15-9-6]|uniref:helix-turn-helix domain-containing protein n=1 Tax=Nesterenkonia sp. K-15-9-6 TaxID=3093918 RepID=UPI0040442749